MDKRIRCILSLLLSMALLLPLFGCGKHSETQLPVMRLYHRFDPDNIVTLREENAEYMLQLLENVTWNPSIFKTKCSYILEYGDLSVSFEVDSTGVVCNDEKNYRSFLLDRGEDDAIRRILQSEFECGTWHLVSLLYPGMRLDEVVIFLGEPNWLDETHASFALTSGKSCIITFTKNTEDNCVTVSSWHLEKSENAE